MCEQLKSLNKNNNMLVKNYSAKYSKGFFRVRVRSENDEWYDELGTRFSFNPKRIKFESFTWRKDGVEVNDVTCLLIGNNPLGGQSTLSIPVSRLALYQMCEVLANWDGKSQIVLTAYNFTNEEGKEKDGVGGYANGEKIEKTNKVPFEWNDNSVENYTNFFLSLGLQVENMPNEDKPQKPVQKEETKAVKKTSVPVPPADDLPF